MAGHNGVSRAGGIVYTYNHADKAPGPGAQYYKVTCYIDFVKRPIHINRYYVPGAELDRFLTEQAETGEIITDIRPVKVKLKQPATEASSRP